MSVFKFWDSLPFFKKEKEPSFEETIHEYDPYLLSSLSPDYILEESNYVQLGSNFTRTLMVVDYEAFQNQEFIQDISELNDNISITYFIEELNTQDIRQKLGKAIKQSNIRSEDTRLDESSKIEADVQSRSAKAILTQLAMGSDKVFHFHMLIHINAPSLKELDRLTQYVKSKVGAIGTVHSPNKRAFDAFESFLPLGKNKVGELTYRMMDSEAVSNFFPFHENEMFVEDGIFKGINEKTKNVILVNDKKLVNKHEFVIGMSGLGKSTYLFMNMMKKWAFGERIIVNDPKGEFGPVFKNLGGEWIQFKTEGGSIINPFDLPKTSYKLDDEEVRKSENPIYDKIPSLLVMFKLMYPDLTDIQENILSELIERTYAEKNITRETDFSKLVATDYPTLSDFNEILQKTEKENPDMYKHLKDFHIGIQIFVKGIYKNIFNGHTNVNVDNDLVAYDSLAFNNNEKVQRILYYNILSHTTNEIINGSGEDTQFYLDEAHVVADPKIPLAMQQVFFMMKVLRSFNCGVTPATQSIKDFLSARDEKRNYGEAVISQSAQRFYLPMAESEVDFLEKHLAHVFSEKERSTLIVREADKKKQAGKGILFIGSKKIQCSVVLTKAEEELWFHKKKLDDILIG